MRHHRHLLQRRDDGPIGHAMVDMRACGKKAVHELEAEGLRALTVESSLISGIPVAGTDFTLRPDDIAAAVAARLGSNSDAGAHR